MTSSLAHPTSRALSKEQTAAVLTELVAIMASDSFSSSKRCRDFFEFVVKRALAGDYDNLTERFLGVELFGRAVDYETATDSIVRVRATDVRRRLAQYYAVERNGTKVRIDLIAGGYIPEFTFQKVAVPSLEERAETIQPALPRKSQPHLRRFWKSYAAATAIAVALCAPMLRPRPSNFDRFWRPVLAASSSPVLSLPTTNTFQLPSDQLYKGLKPGDPLKLGSKDVAVLESLHNWHVSLPVVQAALSVALALQRYGKTPLVRVGTDLRMDELRGHPIIAIGSFSNPWTKQNVAGLRFTFDRGASDNEPPHIGDALNPRRSWSLAHIYPEAQDKDYAIVTRTFDPVTRAPFVSLAGLHSFGNQIAGEFVAQESSWNQLAARAPAGWEKMNLQVLLETNVIGTTPSPPKIVDAYFWK